MSVNIKQKNEQSKIELSSRVLKSNMGIILAEAHMPLSALPLNPNVRTFFVQPLSAVNYHEKSDAIA
jgi:hypothetical protein